MSQNEYTLPDSQGGVYRAEDNDRAKAIASWNAGSGDPPETVAYMKKLDLLAGLLVMRNAPNNGWITLANWTGDKLIWLHTQIKGLATLQAPAIEDKLVIFDASADENKSILLPDFWKVVDGFTELTTPDGAADFVVVYDASAGEVRKVKVATLRGVTSYTPVNTTSGAAIDFINIPVGAKKITVMSAGVSLSGTNDLLVQIGDAGGIEATDYVSNSNNLNQASGSSGATSELGFVVRCGVATHALHGNLELTLQDAANNTWTSSHVMRRSDDSICGGGGSKSLSGVLTRLRLIPDGGDTFDGGSVNILIE